MSYRYPRTRLGDALVILGTTVIGIALGGAIAENDVPWWVVLIGGFAVGVLGVLVRDWIRPSIWTPWGRFWLDVESRIVHPSDQQKRAQYQYERGFNDSEFEEEEEEEEEREMVETSGAGESGDSATSGPGDASPWGKRLWGIVVGVAVGLLVAIIIYAAGFVRERQQRRDDLQVLCGLVGEMRSSFDDPQLDSGNPPDVPVLLIKRTVFEGFGRRIEDALDNALPKITYDEKTEIRGILGDAEIHRLAGDGTVEMYDEQLAKLESMPWLTCLTGE